MLSCLPSLIPPCLRCVELTGVAFALDHKRIEDDVAEVALPVLIKDSFAFHAQLVLELVDDGALEIMSLASGSGTQDLSRGSFPLANLMYHSAFARSSASEPCLYLLRHKYLKAAILAYT